MNYVEKVLDGVYSALNVNAATLSGAIDIIVVPQEDGTLKSTPFHVRFGKMQSFVADEKIVSIFVNDELIDLKMKLGKAGEAYFVEDLPQDELDSVQTESVKPSPNPIPSSISLESKLDSVTNESEDLSQWLTVNEGPIETLPNSISKVNLPPDPQTPTVDAITTSSTTTTTATPTPVPPPPTWQWSWGMFPTFKFRKGTPASKAPQPETSVTTTTTTLTTPQVSENVPSITISSDKIEDSQPLVPILEEDPLIVGTTPIFSGTEDPETSTTPLSGSAPITIPVSPSSSSPSSLASSFSPPKSDSALLTLGTNPNPSPANPNPSAVAVPGSEVKPKPTYSSPMITAESIANLQAAKVKVEFSRCAQYLGNSVEEIQGKLLEGYKEIDMIFHEHRLSAAEIAKDPSLLFSPQVLLKLQNQIYPVTIGLLQLLNLMAFQAFLPPELLSSLADSNPSLSFKYAHPPPSIPTASTTTTTTTTTTTSTTTGPSSDKKWTKFSGWRWGGGGGGGGGPPSATTHSLKEKDLVEALSSKPSPSTTTTNNNNNSGSSSSSVSLPVSPVSKRSKRTFKTLRPSSEDLLRMKLKPGSNPIRFRISSFRGQTEVRAHVFLWEKDSKIVISDIDGTITKSDVFGQILPFLGRDWSHSGIVKLYSTIKHNNYHVLYLSARAIGQANSTRGYVTSLKQGEQMMPMGPVFLSPTRLLSSFNQEVIQRTPQKFKIECLKDVSSLFPENSHPFYAGFGNRMTDVISYEAVGIPAGKIFTINPKGEISIAKSSVTSQSYETLNDLVEHMFPPNISPVVSEEWNNFNFWKPPPPSLTDQ